VQIQNQALPRCSQYYLKIIAALLLCLITFVLFSNNNGYEFVGDDLLQNSNFTRGLESWESGNKPASVIVGHQLVMLQSTNEKELVYIKQNLEKENTDIVVKISGLLKLEGVEKGTENWQKAHFLLVGLDEENNKIYQEPHFLISLSGTKDWKKYSKVIRVKADIVRLQFGLQLAMVSGKIWAKELSVKVVEQVKWYSLYWLVTVAIWFMYFLWVSKDYLMSHRMGSRDKVVGIIVVITFMGLLLPDEFSVIIKSYINEITRFDVILDEYQVDCNGCSDKIQHFLLFFFIAVFSCLGLNSINDIYRRAFLIMFLAFIAEILQLLVDGRNFELLDFSFGLIGVIGALIFVYLYHKYVSLCS